MGGKVETSADITLQGRPEAVVDDRFVGIRQQVESDGAGQPAPIEGTVTVLKELYTQLTAAQLSVDGGQPPPQSEVPTKLRAEAARMPEPLRTLMLTLSATSAGQALGSVRTHLSGELNTSVGVFCQQAITGRYPFVRSSARDVTPEDFARMFAPGGLMDQFFQSKLMPYVDISTRPWSFRRIGEASMGTGSGALIEFQRAQVLRDVFFRGNNLPSLRIEFKPLEMDASITQFILDIDGQLVKYSHGPTLPMSIQWPGPRGSNQVRLQVQPSTASGTSGKVFEGPWALFRMFDRLSIEPAGQPERFNITFDVDGRKARFEVRASSVQNPFRLPELDQFHCPSEL
jgi:type VI secretion system protein ImpL